MTFSARQKARPGHIGLALCLATLAACGGGSTSTADQRGATAKQDNAIAPNRPAAADRDAGLVSNDPALLANDVVLHEYSDPPAGSGNARAKAKAAYQPRFLSASEIRHTLIGHELTDGVHWSMRFATNGRITRDEDGGIGHGRWTIRGNEFCLDDLCHKVSKSDGLIQLWRDGAISIEAELR